MRIEPFSLRLSSPLNTARAELLDREGFLVGLDPDVDTGVTSSGVGEATPIPGWTESAADCEQALREIGPVKSHGNAVDGIKDGGSGHDGITALATLDPEETPAARHGVALALADADARDRNVPLAERLADRAGLPAPSTSFPVNATIGDGDVATAVETAERAVDDGYSCLKLKVGARPIDDDIERLRAVRRAVGPAVELRADANGAWSRKTARRALNRLRRVDLAYVEQPLPAADLDGLARLREECRVPIAVDESLSTVAVSDVLAAEAADVVVLKPMALGGPMETLAAACRAREARVDPVITTTIDGVVARVGAVHIAAAVPDVGACGLATGSLLAEDLAPDPSPVEDGTIEVPEGPGLAGGRFDDALDVESNDAANGRES